MLSNGGKYTPKGTVNFAEECAEKFYKEFNVVDHRDIKFVYDTFNAGVEQIESMNCSGQYNHSSNQQTIYYM